MSQYMSQQVYFDINRSKQVKENSNMICYGLILSKIVKILTKNHPNDSSITRSPGLVFRDCVLKQQFSYLVIGLLHIYKTALAKPGLFKSAPWLLAINRDTTSFSKHQLFFQLLLGFFSSPDSQSSYYKDQHVTELTAAKAKL